MSENVGVYAKANYAGQRSDSSANEDEHDRKPAPHPDVPLKWLSHVNGLTINYELW